MLGYELVILIYLITIFFLITVCFYYLLIRNLKGERKNPQVVLGIVSAPSVSPYIHTSQ